MSPYGHNLDGGSGDDSLIFEERKEDYLFGRNVVDRNLPIEIVKKIDEM